ncbi:YycH family regulatory protein [Paenibacillus xylaniclasticus]|uniref:YycH family regulatory protein n=1 Tax=Paenibacillus xylaniclasticus TaxID=588083 RepID=UPI000FD9AAD7|nr:MULTISPECIES: two-component system activity regulator YycH [Paenibacillus]GFN31332.1 hypothetical protein PCURB6_15920 [Paenibacillus curdlanolyticus]
MIERLKTAILTVLIVLSLLQSYWLAYSMPGLKAVRTEIDYVNTEPMGPAQQIENVIFPDSIVLHLGNQNHTVLYPPSNFYDLVFNKLQTVGFKGFTRYPVNGYDWHQIREKKRGVELRFGGGVPVALLEKLMKLEGDLRFMGDQIERVWIYSDEDTGLVHAYLFSSDGRAVYEAARTDLTAHDVEEYVGFGEYGTPYKAVGNVFVPEFPIEAVEAVVGYDTYTPEQMQRSLFFDPGTTLAMKTLSGAEIITDGKRGLQIEQNGNWVSYTNPAAPQTTENNTTDNVLASMQFINEHGGWDGLNRYVPMKPSADVAGEESRTVLFQQYYGAYPIVSDDLYKFGYMRLLLQQGVVTEYERSLMTLKDDAVSKSTRWLPGGNRLRSALDNMDRQSEIVALYPAVQVIPSTKDSQLRLAPVWAARYADGTQKIVAGPMSDDYDGSAERRAWQDEVNKRKQQNQHKQQQQKGSVDAKNEAAGNGIGQAVGGFNEIGITGDSAENKTSGSSMPSVNGIMSFASQRNQVQ